MQDKKPYRPQKISTKIRWVRIPITLLGLVFLYGFMDQLFKPVVDASHVCMLFYGVVLSIFLFIYYSKFKRVSYDKENLYITYLRRVTVVPLASITKIKLMAINIGKPTIKPKDQLTWTIHYEEEGNTYKARFLALSLKHVEDLIKQTTSINPKIEVSEYTINNSWV